MNTYYTPLSAITGLVKNYFGHVLLVAMEQNSPRQETGADWQTTGWRAQYQTRNSMTGGFSNRNNSNPERSTMEIPAPGSVIPVSYQPDALFPGQDMRRQQLIGMAAGSGHLKQAPANEKVFQVATYLQTLNIVSGCEIL